MRQQGFTIIELMITVALVAIIAGLGIPSFRDVIAKNRIISSINEFHQGVRLARAEAVKRSDDVVFCASSNQTSCTGGWGSGWLIYQDADGDSVVDSNEIIRVGEPVYSGYTLSYSGTGTSLTFTGRGLLSTSGGTFKLCGSDKDAKRARGIILLTTGATRRSLDTDGSGIQEDDGGDDFSC